LNFETKNYFSYDEDYMPENDCLIVSINDSQVLDIIIFQQVLN